MAEARQREAWSREAALMALLANLHRDPKKGRALKPADFDPFAIAAKPAPVLKADIGILKQIFINGKSGSRQG